MELSGKNVVITGGLGGIGYETCKSLLKNGISKLAILDIKEDSKAVSDLASNYPNAAQILFLRTNVSIKTDVDTSYKTVIEKFKRIDIVINCSGVIEEKNVELTIGVNLLGVINSCLAALEYMSKETGGPGGLIVNIASVGGLEPLPPVAIYTATKHGVIGFTRSLAFDLYYEKMGVAFIIACPGVTDTPMLKRQNLTFECAAPLMDGFLIAKRQSAEECASGIVEIVKTGKNGSIWIVDLGKYHEVKPHLYWQPTFNS